MTAWRWTPREVPIVDTADLLIFGASARAAAHSALRAGLRPWCADLFADADLRTACPVRRVAGANYPHGLLAALEGAPNAPLLYTGGLENHPRLFDRLDRPLWGNGSDVLRQVRDPLRLARCLAEARIDAPAVRDTPPAPGDPRRWLLKPRRGAGGFGIHPYENVPFEARTHFLQERLEGDSCSAVFLGRSEGGVDLLGVTQQLVGAGWLGAADFRYAGSVCSLDVMPSERLVWERIGQALVAAFDLRGLFGVDAIRRDGVPWPVEVNPRYTASVEVLERSLGISALALHRAACAGLPLPRFARATAPRTWGKAIYFAAGALTFPAEGPWRVALAPGVDRDRVPFADVPAAGERIERGHPILTVFASGADASACLGSLREIARGLDRRLTTR